MDRITQLLGPTNTNYAPLETHAGAEGESFMNEQGQDADESGTTEGAHEAHLEAPFSWTHYLVFLLLGVAMLWAWNMFLAAGPYFQSRFRSNTWILANFQSAELTVSTAINLGIMVILTKRQANASYPKRIILALMINVVVFSLLAASTRISTGVSAETYFAFMLIQVFLSSSATGLLQNGIFAYMSGFGREEYAQGCMTGQAIAGVLPCIVQIVSVLSVPPVDATKEATKESHKSALVFFATAVAVSLATLLAFFHLLRKSRTSAAYRAATQHDQPRTAQHKSVPLMIIYRKTFFLSTSVFVTFVIAMFYPVFTQQITSVNQGDLPRILQPTSFIPLSMLIWNIGDLLGRVISAMPSLSITSRPHLMLTLAVARVFLVPLYLLCNVKNHGAIVNSDLFYFLLQLVYGTTNGFMGTMGMMGAVEYVDVHEREAAGAFMTLMLTGGLTVGSLLSFIAA